MSSIGFSHALAAGPGDTSSRAVHVAVVLGTRPEAIKLAPVLRAMENSPLFSPVLVSTGQHRDMLAQMLPRLRLTMGHDLAVMRERQQLSTLTARLIGRLGEVIREERPDLVMVQGDTSSTLCGALAAFYDHVPVAHVEAGLRSGVIDDPFPEELNRRLVTQMTRWHFAPTPRAAAALTDEAVPAERVMVTGNTVIDSLLWARRQGEGRSAFVSDRRGLLVTLHRRENQGPRMRALAATLLKLAERRDVEVLVPLHKSPAVRDVLLPALGGHPRITLTEPLDYFDFIATLAACELVLTDSGGVQEEAPSFDKPVLVLRETTERPEVVRAGAAELVGTDPGAVHTAAASLLDDPVRYRHMAGIHNPFGDGHAADRIVARLARDFGRTLAPAPALEVTAA
ncbi:UDP-N-acetylglucosamine 2-epimerase (non-hydrolyzing) [Streptomyces piniterrae]|uniref:UDP-N-acetylglucosamine 2-epimerase (non-hydrolyzing) n=1 Tax=Streptomyces piniterrae TaxID=2571125 RepID=A0A4U0P867_9ACTN|nr:UDP-N-acetylglucosamine 2-epimerase (non-hydrolyzing) [Streptomyces piniterrae]TJZ58924.1 UDP-N-acetylglucosamine 2-epimerase (non-hydrolyzing) [Streptomyces piniterrae]